MLPSASDQKPTLVGDSLPLVAAIEPPGTAAMLRGMNGLRIFAVQKDPRDAAYNAPSIGPAPPFAQYNSLSHAETAGAAGLL
jgi:hypothetical protein